MRARARNPIAILSIAIIGVTFLAWPAFGATERWEVDTPIGKINIVSEIKDAFPSFRSSSGYLSLTGKERSAFNRTVLRQFGMGAEEWPTHSLADIHGLFAIPTVVIGGVEFFSSQYSRNVEILRHRLPEKTRFNNRITVRVYSSTERLRAAHSGWDAVEGKVGYFDVDNREIGIAIDESFLDEFYPEHSAFVDIGKRAAVALRALRRSLLPTLYHEFVHLLQLESGEFEYDSPFLSEGQATYLASKLERQEILLPLVAVEFGESENALKAAAAVAVGRLLTPDEYSRLARLRTMPLGDGGRLEAVLLMTPKQFLDPKLARQNYDLAWLFFFFLDSQEETAAEFKRVRKIALNLSATRKRHQLAEIEARMADAVKANTDDPITALSFASLLAKTVGIHDQGIVRKDPKPLSVYAAYTNLLKIDPDNPELQSYLGDLFLQQGSRDVFVAMYDRAFRRQSQPGAMRLGGKVRVVNRYVDALWELRLYQRVADLVQDYSFTDLDVRSLAEINLKSAFLERFAGADAATRDKLECEFQLGQELAMLYALDHNPSLQNAKNVIKAEGDEATREAYRGMLELMSRKFRAKLGRTMRMCRIEKIPKDAWYLTTWQISQVRINPSKYVAIDREHIPRPKMSAWDWFYNSQEQKAAENQIESLTKALELDPFHLPALINRCLANRNLDRFEAALLDCNRAVEVGPTLSVVYNNRGWVHFGMGNLDKAIADYSQSLEIDKNYSIALKNRAQAYAKLGDLKLAEFDYRKLVAVYPEHPGHLNELAWFLIDREIDVSEGVELAKRAVEKRPSDANLLDTLGWGYFKAGETQQAIKWLERATAANPDSDEIRNHLESAKAALNHQ